MKEVISEFWGNVRDRLSNPFIFSFIIAWLILNWKIWLGLIWYNNQQITSVENFVTGNLDAYQSLWSPLCYALGYTLIGPWLKAGISALNTLASLYSEKWNLSISKDGNVPMTKFLSFKNNYEERTRTLETIIKNENITAEQYENEKTLRLTKEEELNSARQKLIEVDAFVNTLFDMSKLNGRWYVTRKYRSIQPVDIDKEIKILHDEKQTWNFISGQVHIYIDGRPEVQAFRVAEMFYDTRRKRILIVLHPTQDIILLNNLKLAVAKGVQRKHVNPEQVLVHDLEIETNDNFVGTENGGSRVEYQRLLV
jgi:hypothetical protein